MRIIVDGNDGVGKTTLATKLQKDLDIKSYIHLSGSDPRNFDFYNNIMRKQNVIFDRSFLDDDIYSIIYNRPHGLSELETRLLTNYLAVSDDIFIIICYTNNKKITKPNETKEVLENEHKIDDYFNSLYKSLSKKRVNFTSSTHKQNIIYYETLLDNELANDIAYNKLLSTIKEFFNKDE